MDQTYAEAQTFVVPSGLSGTFYLFGFVDKGERVYERGSEANNVAFDALAMLITESPPADLVAGTITIPANGVPGQSATITYTVHNQGANPALGRWFDSLYLSADDQWDLSDKLFGRVEHSGDVPGGAGYTETLTAPVPGVKPGDYHLIVRSDIRNHIPESDETNNVGASLDRTAIDVEVLVPGVPAVGTLGTASRSTTGSTLRRAERCWLPLTATPPRPATSFTSASATFRAAACSISLAPTPSSPIRRSWSP